MMKNVFFTTVLLLITYVFIEIFGYAAYRIKFGDYQIPALQIAKLDAIKANRESGVFVPENERSTDITTKPILHPYVGFSVEGHRRKADCESTSQVKCYARIKIDTDRPFVKRAKDKLIIGILGGSFADGTGSRAKNGVANRTFRALPIFADKSEVIVYNMAAGAYKQPQQLTQMAYFMALGAEFDIVINLDGFNEIAGSYYGWRDSQLHPAFPKSWNHRVNSALSKEYLTAFAKKFNENNNRRRFAELSSKFPLRWSPTINFIWQIADNRSQNKVSEYDLEITTSGSDSSNRDTAYEALGPEYHINNFSELANYTATMWADSSISMRALAEGRGARYYHFLQPNQYIEGAKALSEEEKETMVLKTGGYGNVYKKGYPYLVKEAQRFTANHVNYHDLTPMFKDNPATLYIDNCCHLNFKGYDLVVAEIAATIGENWYDL